MKTKLSILEELLECATSSSTRSTWRSSAWLTCTKMRKFRNKMRRMHDDMGYTHYFFILLGLIAHTNTASPVAVSFCYFYVAVFGLSFLGYFKDIHILPLVSYAIQLALLFGIWLCIMVDDWCDFFIGRYAFNN
ncbi:unnamed protein product [Moneuplotes crassus]|uniref:Uncharacterized protein n=1 Tax=Euplotes crassus TaxID=5936 RepID=A0AAD1Y246_EUPCR|nr:unnamed protein product [Moneuplotes crassus]